MELYHKKLNTKKKKENNRYNNNRYNPKENSFNETANKTFYVQKMFRKKNIIQQKDELNLSSQNFQNVFNNVENLFTDDNSKKKAIKYVLQIGKNKPNKSFLNRTMYQFYNNHQKYKENPEESHNEIDIDISLTNEDDLINNNRNYFTDRTKLRQISEPNNRLSKSLQKRKQRMNNVYNKNRRNDEDIIDNETEELIKVIEELQEMNMNLRKKGIKKNNEINILKNEIDNLQKELDEKMAEHDKEIEKIYNYKNTNNEKENELNNEKLKMEYYKLLEQYDKNICDFNDLKDKYNTTVDEYNNLKTEKNNLKNSFNLLKNEYNTMKEEANKTVDDYNNIVDDYAKLEKENKQLKIENEKLKQEKINKINKKELIIDDNNNIKLKEEYEKLKSQFDKIKNENKILKQ